MSLLSSFIARRFSGAAPPAEASNDAALASPALTCDTPPTASSSTPPEHDAPTTDDIAVPAAVDRRPTLIDRFRRYSSFSRPAPDAVVEEDGNGTSDNSTTAPIAIPVDTSMSRDRPRTLDQRFRQLNLDPSTLR